MSAPLTTPLGNWSKRGWYSRYLCYLSWSNERLFSGCPRFLSDGVSNCGNRQNPSSSAMGVEGGAGVADNCPLLPRLRKTLTALWSLPVGLPLRQRLQTAQPDFQAELKQTVRVVFTQLVR